MSIKRGRDSVDDACPFPSKKGLVVEDTPHVWTPEPGDALREDPQSRAKMFIDWTLEEVGEKPMPLRYSVEAAPPMPQILIGVPVHVDLPQGRQRHGLLKFNPVSTRWIVSEGAQTMHLADFCEGAILHSAPSNCNSGWLPRDVLLETETKSPVIPDLEKHGIPTRQWFIFNKVAFPALTPSFLCTCSRSFSRTRVCSCTHTHAHTHTAHTHTHTRTHTPRTHTYAHQHTAHTLEQNHSHVRARARMQPQLLPVHLSRMSSWA